MTLYLPGGFRWGPALDLLDPSGRPRYRLTGDGYAPARRLHITDLAGREAVYVRQTLPALFPTCALEVYGKPLGSLVKDLTRTPAAALLEALDWEISEAGGSLLLLEAGAQIAALTPTEEAGLRLDLGQKRTELAALGALLGAAYVLGCGTQKIFPGKG